MPSPDLISEAYSHWKNGEDVETGRLLFERLPNEFRPKWAANILRLVIQRTGTKSDVIAHALSIADHPEDWGKAHQAFDKLRDATLKLERIWWRSPREQLLLSQLLLAELVAKVTYNAIYPVDEFDEDSGWSIPLCLKGVLNRLNDEKFSELMWSALADHPN